MLNATTTLLNATIPVIDVAAPGLRVCPVNDYGQALLENKAQILGACLAGCAGRLEECTLLLAMAMIETTTMNASLRDATKDGTSAANVGLWNLSVDLIGALNHTGDPWGLNAQTPRVLVATACALLRGLRTWGAARLLNFVRGGRTAFLDGVSFDAFGYRETVASLLNAIAADPRLMYDSRRVDCPLRHV